MDAKFESNGTIYKRGWKLLCKIIELNRLFSAAFFGEACQNDLKCFLIDFGLVLINREAKWCVEFSRTLEKEMQVRVFCFFFRSTK